ncbi:mitofilin family membrane protein [Azospirillum sp. TSO35-2]|uniref:COG4223 family protein n=1 Tax=Azospirillum sp. TSO35-2 TaxID=716796 RepID=UPI000D618CB8|nr:mitofilin family membrane protein [Azospirillum sp. TSO35-2]PWC34115.1 hypothetical protein TSO352_27800 [Azospirillum sp. TSO35-2]
MTSRPGSERPGSDRGGSDRPAPDRDGDGASPSNTAGSNAAVDRIVERFGGIRPMANKLDTPVTTVQGWKKRGAIPLARHADLRSAAAKHRIKLDDADLDAATPSEDRPAIDSAATTAVAVEPVPTASPADSIPGGTPVIIDAPAEPQGGDALVPPATPIEAASPIADPDAPKPGAEPLAADPSKIDAGKIDADKAEEVKPSATATPWTTSGSGTASSRIESEPARPTIGPSPAYVDEPRSGSGFATALSIVALLVGAAALAEPWWGPTLAGWPAASAPSSSSAPAAAPADPALRAQIQQLTDRIGKLEQRPAAQAAAQPANGNAEAAVAALTQRIDALEKRPAATADTGAESARKELADRIAGLEQKLTAVSGNSQAAQALRGDVDQLKQQLSGVSQAVEQRQDAAASAQALVLAAGQLRATLANGQPFQQDLQAVRALGIADAGVTQPLDAVAPYAAKGIPTRAQLTDRFQPLTGEIVRAEVRGEGNSWIDSAVGKLSTLVTVRREGGGVVGTTADAIVARAEAALNSGNLAKAVEELSALQGPAAQVAAPWLADAKARLAADQAARQLNDRAIALLTTAAGGKGAAQ